MQREPRVCQVIYLDLKPMPDLLDGIASQGPYAINGTFGAPRQSAPFLGRIQDMNKLEGGESRWTTRGESQDCY